MRHINVLAAALAAAASMGSSADAEVVPRGLGAWVTANNKRPKGYRPPILRQRRQRLQRATGPGSYDEWKKALAAERAAKRASHNGNGDAS